MQHIYYNTIQQVNDHFGIETLHPLITVVHLNRRTEMPEELRYHYGVYGLPTVAYFADKCCLSTGYFGTLVKTETGRTAKDIINDRLLARAKELLSISSPRGGREGALSITQVSQRLGFEYPQHFVRFFKSFTGKTPAQWRVA